MQLYDYLVTDQKGQEKPMVDYRGQVLLIVNTATACGFTPQYEELQKLYDTYHDQGFSVLDFPCNQFGNQAPGSDEEILSFCTLNYGVSFPIFHKIDVNGDNAEPLFQHLKAQKGFAGFDPAHKLSPLLDQMLLKADPEYAKKADIKWNFTKFLVNRQGDVVARFEPTADMVEVQSAVKALL